MFPDYFAHSSIFDAGLFRVYLAMVASESLADTEKMLASGQARSRLCSGSEWICGGKLERRVGEVAGVSRL